MSINPTHRSPIFSDDQGLDRLRQDRESQEMRQQIEELQKLVGNLSNRVSSIDSQVPSLIPTGDSSNPSSRRASLVPSQIPSQTSTITSRPPIDIREASLRWAPIRPSSQQTQNLPSTSMSSSSSSSSTISSSNTSTTSSNTPSTTSASTSSSSLWYPRNWIGVRNLYKQVDTAPQSASTQQSTSSQSTSSTSTVAQSTSTQQSTSSTSSVQQSSPSSSSQQYPSTSSPVQSPSVQTAQRDPKKQILLWLKNLPTELEGQKLARIQSVKAFKNLLTLDQYKTILELQYALPKIDTSRTTLDALRQALTEPERQKFDTAVYRAIGELDNQAPYVEDNRSQRIAGAKHFTTTPQSDASKKAVENRLTFIQSCINQQASLSIRLAFKSAQEKQLKEETQIVESFKIMSITMQLPILLEVAEVACETQSTLDFEKQMSTFKKLVVHLQVEPKDYRQLFFKKLERNIDFAAKVDELSTEPLFNEFGLLYFRTSEEAEMQALDNAVLEISVLRNILVEMGGEIRKEAMDRLPSSNSSVSSSSSSSSSTVSPSTNTSPQNTTSTTTTISSGSTSTS